MDGRTGVDSDYNEEEEEEEPRAEGQSGDKKRVHRYTPRLYIAGVPLDVDPAEIQSCFGGYAVKEVTIGDGKELRVGFASVEFETIEDRVEAFRTHRWVYVRDVPLDVMNKRPMMPWLGVQDKLTVKGVPAGVDKKAIQTALGCDDAEVDYLREPRGRRGGVVRVTFSSHEDALKALRENRWLKVEGCDRPLLVSAGGKHDRPNDHRHERAPPGGEDHRGRGGHGHH